MWSAGALAPPTDAKLTQRGRLVQFRVSFDLQALVLMFKVI
jgi:hypothetical protein